MLLRGKRSSPEKTNQSLNQDESIDDPIPMQEDSIEVPPVLDLNINTDESDQDEHTTDKPNTDEHVLSVLEQPPSSLDSDSEDLIVPAPAPISVEDDDSSDPVNITDAARGDMVPPPNGAKRKTAAAETATTARRTRRPRGDTCEDVQRNQEPQAVFFWQRRGETLAGSLLSLKTRRPVIIRAEEEKRSREAQIRMRLQTIEKNPGPRFMTEEGRENRLY